MSAIIATSCSKTISGAETDQEFAERLAHAFSAGDYDALEALSHPETPPELIPKMRQALAPFFKVRPDTVSHSFTNLPVPDIDLPGTIDGRELVYTSAVDGVVHLEGKSKDGDLRVDLFVPYQRVDGAYFSAAVGYAVKTKKAKEDGAD